MNLQQQRRARLALLGKRHLYVMEQGTPSARLLDFLAWRNDRAMSMRVGIAHRRRDERWFWRWFWQRYAQRVRSRPPCPVDVLTAGTRKD